MSTSNVWMGFSDEQNEGTWQWVDKSIQTSYTYWSNGEPNNYQNEDCAGLLGDTYYWNDYQCSKIYPILCSS